MPMPGTTPPFVIPALLALGVSLTMIYGGPQETKREDYPVTIHLPKATYDALSRGGNGSSDIQDRATRMVIEAARR